MFSFLSEATHIKGSVLNFCFAGFKTSALVQSSALSQASLRVVWKLTINGFLRGIMVGQGRALIKRLVVGADSADAPVQLELSAVRQSVTFTWAQTVASDWSVSREGLGVVVARSDSMGAHLNAGCEASQCNVWLALHTQIHSIEGCRASWDSLSVRCQDILWHTGRTAVEILRCCLVTAGKNAVFNPNML